MLVAQRTPELALLRATVTGSPAVTRAAHGPPPRRSGPSALRHTGRPDTPAETPLPGPEPGRVKILGRHDHQIKIRQRQVSLGQLQPLAGHLLRRIRAVRLDEMAAGIAVWARDDLVFVVDAGVDAIS